MSAATQKAKVSVDALFEQVRQFSDTDLDAVLDATLVIGISRPLADDVLERYRSFEAGLKADKLTRSDYAKLLRLIDIVEAHNAKRIRYLANLADLRETTLKSLIKLPEFSIHFNNPALV